LKYPSDKSSEDSDKSLPIPTNLTNGANFTNIIHNNLEKPAVSDVNDHSMIPGAAPTVVNIEEEEPAITENPADKPVRKQTKSSIKCVLCKKQCKKQ
jgi:hypothetical protein